MEVKGSGEGGRELIIKVRGGEATVTQKV